MDVIVCAVTGLAFYAWFSMTYEARREMQRWFWLMMVAGAVAGIGWQWARDGTLSLPAIQYDQSL